MSFLPRSRANAPVAVQVRPGVSQIGDARAGGSVEALSRRATTHGCGQGLLLGFSNIAEENALATCRHSMA